ncbi:MAG TPA: hypothetical protein VFD01_10340 [Candidatus Dormibacteraeota bacterium]|nr:hypothetical protein [Candidatus Dormibacteraeota bacterium]
MHVTQPPSSPNRSEAAVEGGDPACWLHLVCPECGRLDPDPERRVCRACGAALPDPEEP